VIWSILESFKEAVLERTPLVVRKIDTLLWLERHGNRLLTRRFASSARTRLRSALEAKGMFDVSISLDGMRITGTLEDRHHLAELAQGSMEALTLKLWREHLAPGANVLDVGAYLGTYSLFAARGVGPTGRVWAVEPNPTSRRVLDQNIAANRLANITVIPKAASDHRANAQLHIVRGDRSAASLLFDVGELEASVAVETVPLDELLPDDVRVSIAKIDVEGAEPAVLRGMTRILAGIDAIFIESHAECLYAAGSSPEELQALLVDHGFGVSVIKEETWEVVPWRSDLVQEGYRNLLATR
jgi:FkbM family methyltransferase